jgi:hypothetical protein
MVTVHDTAVVLAISYRLISNSRRCVDVDRAPPWGWAVRIYCTPSKSRGSGKFYVFVEFLSLKKTHFKRVFRLSARELRVKMGRKAAAVLARTKNLIHSRKTKAEAVKKSHSEDPESASPLTARDTGDQKRCIQRVHYISIYHYVPHHMPQTSTTGQP